MPLNYGNGNGNRDGFRIISGLELPDTRRSWNNYSMNQVRIEMACRRNCSELEGTHGSN